MSGLNKVCLIGRLGRDPESRNFSNGNRVVNFRMATSEKYKDRDGNAVEKTEWHSIAIFNEKLGEIAERYLKKGSLCYVEGKLETRKWTDKENIERYSTEVVLRQFNGTLVLLGGRGDDRGGDDQDQSSTHGATKTHAGAAAHRAADLNKFVDDDIPF